MPKIQDDRLLAQVLHNGPHDAETLPTFWCIKSVWFLAWKFFFEVWLSRNDVAFKKTKPNSFLQVTFRGTYQTKCWSLLSKEEEENALKKNCRLLEMTVMEILSKFGWKFSNKIEA